MEPEISRNTTGNPALHLWYAYASDVADAETEAACAALLNDAERARAARFRFARHRREYLASHALARNALSHAHPLPPYAWNYSVNAHGKPTPIPGSPRTGLRPWGGIPGSPRTGLRPWGGIPECGLRFNQSNSVELAVCLVASHGTETDTEAGPEVGVDVEAFSRAEEIVPLAPKVFSLAEQAQLNALPAAERPHRALSLWTLKEAYIKARGMGLSLPLRGISFLFGEPQGVRFEVDADVDDDPARWRFCLLDHFEHRIALGVEVLSSNFKTPSLEIFEARPPFAAPTRLPSGPETWFPLLAAASRSHAGG